MSEKCNNCGTPLNDHPEPCITVLKSKLDARSVLVAEIVAWFDVAQQNYDLYDGTVHDEWPTDWLRRARESVK